MAGLTVQRDIDRFWAKVIIDCACDCWVWVGARTEGGYGQFRVGGRRGQVKLAHRLAWETWRGPIPPELQIDHLCRVRACVNPAHMEPVSQRVNILRGTGYTARSARRTECPNGHPHSEETNGFTGRGKRYCKTCNRDRARAWRAAHPVGAT